MFWKFGPEILFREFSLNIVESQLSILNIFRNELVEYDTEGVDIR